MSHTRLLQHLALTIALLVSAPAQEQCTTFQIVAAAVDAKSTPMNGLASENFRLKVGDATATIKSASPTSQSVRVVIILDASASMRSFLKEHKKTTPVVDDFIASIPEQAPLGAVVFAE